MLGRTRHLQLPGAGAAAHQTAQYDPSSPSFDLPAIKKATRAGHTALAMSCRESPVSLDLPLIPPKTHS